LQARDRETASRRLNGYELVEKIISDVRFEDGMEVRGAA